MAPRAVGRPQSAQDPRKPESMVMPNPIVNALINGQEVPCLIGQGSEVTAMEYDFSVQRFEMQDQLDLFWLSLKGAITCLSW